MNKTKLIFPRLSKKQDNKFNREFRREQLENFKKGGYLAVVIGNLKKAINCKLSVLADNFVRMRKETSEIMSLFKELKKRKLIFKVKNRS